MERLSTDSLLRSLPGSGARDSDPTPRPGSTPNAGMTTFNPAASREWLVSQRPEVVDDKIRRSLTSQLGVVVSENREWRFPEGRPAYQVTTTAGLTGLSTDTQPLALEKVKAAMTPVTRDQAEVLVSQMSAVLARRSSSEDSAEIAFDIYVSILCSHPADVATDVVRKLCTEPREDGKSAWLPSPPEIEGLCRAASASRTALVHALTFWREPSDDEKAVIRAEQKWRTLQTKATALGFKVGPGPATDTGDRGDRIAAHDAALAEAGAAKLAWLEAVKKISA